MADLNLLAAIAQLRPSRHPNYLSKHSQVALFSDEAHELLPSELGSKAPAIVIHTCDDVEGGNDLQRAKLIKPTLTQTKRPPRID